MVVENSNVAVGEADAVAVRGIKRHHCLVLKFAKATILHAIEAGLILLEVKKRVGHGNWLAWLERHLPDIGETTLQLYKRIAKHWCDHEEDRPIIEAMSVSEAASFIAALSPRRKSAEIADFTNEGEREDEDDRPTASLTEALPPALFSRIKSDRDKNLGVINAVMEVGVQLEGRPKPKKWLEGIESTVLGQLEKVVPSVAGCVNDISRELKAGKNARS